MTDHNQIISEDDLKFQQAKAFLMQADAEGQCTYDHLQALVAEMLDSNPNDVSHHPERLAALSSQLKKHKFVTGDTSKSTNSAPVTHHTQLAAATANKALFETPQADVSTTVEKPTPYTTVTTTTTKPKAAPQFKSVVAENSMWKHCGAALPNQEAFLLDQSITRLAAQRQLEEVRFVGKILGINANYIVISTKRFVPENEKVYEEVYAMPKPPRKKVEVDVQPEPGFKGCNRLSFWVTPDANSDWTLLPDVTPQQVNASRNIRKFFSGDLNATINAHPAFVGSEAIYLRSQLSRILASTYITPAGVLEKVDDEEEEEEDAEDEDDGKVKGPKPAKYFALTKLNKEFEGETTQAFADPEQWVHSENYIYETGRQTKIPEKPEMDEEEDPAEDEDEEEEGEEKKEEEERELFLPINKDSSYAIIHLPKEPNPEDDDEEEPEEEDVPAEGEDEDKDAESEKDEEEDDIADDDPLRKKIPAWTTRQTNTVYKNHAVVVVRSLRWPGAVAYASNKGKNFGAVYIGWGFKKTDTAFTPTAATEIIKEAEDIVETVDPTAGNEKLVMRGEDPKEADSEDEKDDDEEDEEEG